MEKLYVIIPILGCSVISIIAGRFSYSAFADYVRMAAEPMDQVRSISNSLHSDGMDFSFAFCLFFAFIAISTAIAALTIAFRFFNGNGHSLAREVDVDGFRDF